MRDLSLVSTASLKALLHDAALVHGAVLASVSGSRAVLSMQHLVRRVYECVGRPYLLASACIAHRHRLNTLTVARDSRKRADRLGPH